MFNRHRLLHQQARPPRWVCLLLGLGIGCGAAWLGRPAGLWSPLWVIALCTLSYAGVRWFWGVHSQVVDPGGDASRRALRLREPHATVYAQVDQAWITRIMPCSYTRWRHTEPVTCDAVDPAYHRVFRQFGYAGPGLVVCYRLPDWAGGQQVERAWQFPAPEAKRMMALLASRVSVTRERAPGQTGRRLQQPEQ